VSYLDKCLSEPPEVTVPPEAKACELPDWLLALRGLCRPCSDAEFYGLRMSHANCTRGDCACTYEIPAEWPAGTWPVKVPADA
jgi:hypothetical protein